MTNNRMNRIARLPKRKKLFSLALLAVIIVTILSIPTNLFVNKHSFYQGAWFYKTIKQILPDPIRSLLLYNHVEVNGSTWRVSVEGSYPYKLQIYNELLQLAREEILERLKNSTWQDLETPLTVISASQEDYLSKLHQVPNVNGVLLAWYPYPPPFETHEANTLLSTGAVMVHHIYPWTATEPLCTWVNGGVNIFGYNKVFGKTCVTNLTDSLEPTSLGAQWWQSNLPRKHTVMKPTYYTQYPDILNHLHIFQHAVVTGLGAAHSGGIKFVPITCIADSNPSPPGKYKGAKLHQEVFVIAQYWARAHFHKMMEDFPRIAPYLDFLLENKEIMVLSEATTGYTAQFLSFLGINETRLLAGVVRAKIAYIPKGTPCGNNLVANTQYLAKVLQDKIEQKYPEDKRDLIILIKRSGQRRFTKHGEIAAMLLAEATKYQLKFEEFNDKKLPSMEGIMRMFHRAVLVVGPHGAGLSNILFSPPGTYVIEGVCNAPISNLCYMREATTLGHHYHGVPAGPGCEGVINVDTSKMEKVLNFYMPHAAKLKGQPGNWAL